MTITMKTVIFAVITELFITCAAGQLQPQDWKKVYTAHQSKALLTYVESAFLCSGPYALCAYAACTPIPNSDPPVAECGCYAYGNTSNLGGASGVLSAYAKQQTKQACGVGKAMDCLTTTNMAPFCKYMNSKTLYKEAKPDYISTYNPDDWPLTTGIQPKTVQCTNGGTFTNCFSAACYKGAPKSRHTPKGSPSFNATCYCPYYTTKTQPFLVWNGTANPCGPTSKAQLTPRTVIFNGL